MSIVFEFPDAADLANDTLATKPHSTLHGDIGDTLEAYIAVLGKVDPTGPNGNPTLFDPASTDATDGAWEEIVWTVSGDTHGVDHHTVVGPDFLADMLVRVQADDDAFHNVYERLSVGSNAAFDEYVQLDWQTQVHADGTQRTAALTFTSDLAGTAVLELTDAHVQAKLKAHAAQTDPLLDLQDSDGNSLVAAIPGPVTTNVRIGFGADPNATYFQFTASDLAGTRAALYAPYVQSTAGTEYVTSEFQDRIDLDGTNRDGHLGIFSDLDGQVLISLTDTYVQAQLKAHAAQSDPLLDLQDSSSASQFAVTPTTSAFFAAAGLDAASRPAVPTQVAVVSVSDFNAIRTAMIALGIWTDGD